MNSQCLPKCVMLQKSARGELTSWSRKPDETTETPESTSTREATDESVGITSSTGGARLQHQMIGNQYSEPNKVLLSVN